MNPTSLVHRTAFPLWSDSPTIDHEIIIERSCDPSRPDRAATRICVPTLTPWLPEKPNGSAAIVIPGGAYERVVLDKEGAEICTWLASLGITGFILKYRLPDAMHDCGYLAPLRDGQRALRLIRAQAADWGIDPARIGVFGFSAGGHLAGMLMNHWDYKIDGDNDGTSARPDFAVLGYPVCSLWGSLRNNPDDIRARLVSEFETDQHIRPDTPPTFLVHADDDPTVPAEQSARIYTALKAAGIEAELHIFQHGGHGFGIDRASGPVTRWPELCRYWLEERGWA